MSDVVINVENLTKEYRLGIINHGTLHRDLQSWWARWRGKEDPNSLISARGRGILSKDNPQLLALSDLSFEVRQGEVLGIIGRNGAGKSTLLKILSRVVAPTRGTVKIKGRVASLLEVGTGFHPELTGRENVYLNGAILGMTKREIRRKFDEIVDFAEVEKFIDTPVKRYSSGMYVRLAFAVAAHLEPEILIVDEVLAVGDAQFQKKSLGKMGEVARGGRTVLFVSHNMGAVNQLCGTAILLKDGRIETHSQTTEATRLYLKSAYNEQHFSEKAFMGTLKSGISFEKLAVNGKKDNVVINPAERIAIDVVVNCKIRLKDFMTSISIYKDDVRLFTLYDVPEPKPLKTGRFKSNVEIPPLFLRPGEYSIAMGGETSNGRQEWIWGTNLFYFTVSEEWGPGYDPHNVGVVNLPGSGQRTFLN